MCEDYPACGHEPGDCEGKLYGSDESIKAQVERDFREGHGQCDHADGLYLCEDEEPEEGDFEDWDGNEDAGYEDALFGGE